MSAIDIGLFKFSSSSYANFDDLYFIRKISIFTRFSSSQEFPTPPSAGKMFQDPQKMPETLKLACFVLSLYILSVLFVVLFLLSFIFSSSYILIAVHSKSHAQSSSLYLGPWCVLFSVACLVGLRYSCWGTLHGQKSANGRRHTGLWSFGCSRQTVNLCSSSLHPIFSHLLILWNKENSAHLFSYSSTPWDPGKLWNLVSTLPWNWPRGKIFLHEFSPTAASPSSEPSSGKPPTTRLRNRETGVENKETRKLRDQGFKPLSHHQTFSKLCSLHSNLSRLVLNHCSL